MSPEEHPFANSNVRILLGLMSSLTIVVVAVLFVDDALLTALMVGIAAVDAVVTPYVLGLAIENAESEEPRHQV
ncbi:hypothetical protein [Halovenus salina]|uniref:Uncharacterized protein n=1 Tax=Halovenus salina TaxID=1510225 RepID=A0ABD5VYN5_9EURY|nr:hypothetical protein [Halovenus salina]